MRETSVEAYRTIQAEGLLSARRWALYCALYRHGPLTANELFRKVDSFSNIQQANVSARLNEMREMGVVQEMGERLCSITGLNVILWDVTTNLPRKLNKDGEPTKREVIVELTDYLAECFVKLEGHDDAWLQDAATLVKYCEKFRRKQHG